MWFLKTFHEKKIFHKILTLNSIFAQDRSKIFQNFWNFRVCEDHGNSTPENGISSVYFEYRRIILIFTRPKAKKHGTLAWKLWHIKFENFCDSKGQKWYRDTPYQVILYFLKKLFLNYKNALLHICLQILLDREG